MRLLALFGILSIGCLGACAGDDAPTRDAGMDYTVDAATEDGPGPKLPDQGAVDQGPLPTEDQGAVDLAQDLTLDQALPADALADAPVDGGADLSPPLPDQGPADLQLSSYAIVITEMLINPSGDDTKREWIELYNAGSTAVNLHGWTLQDQAGSYQETHLIQATQDAGVPLEIAPGQYLVLARNGVFAENGGITPAYVYSDWALGNSGDEIYLFDEQKALVDTVEYDSSKGWTIPNGASLSLKDPSLDNNDPANWCTETTAWTGSAADKGTPGDKAGCGTP